MSTLDRSLFKRIKTGDIVKFDAPIHITSAYNSYKEPIPVTVTLLENFENITLSSTQLKNILRDFEFAKIEPVYPDEIQKRLY